MCAKHHFICERFFVFVFITSLGRNCGRTKPAFLRHPDSLQGLAEAQVGGAHANECGLCVTEPQWWNHITVRTLLTTTTIFSELLASRSEKKSMEKGQNYYISASWAFYTGDRTLFVWNQSSYNREVSFFKNGEFPDKQPTVTYGDGDGIVNKRSLEACNKWSQR